MSDPPLPAICRFSGLTSPLLMNKGNSDPEVTYTRRWGWPRRICEAAAAPGLEFGFSSHEIITCNLQIRPRRPPSVSAVIIFHDTGLARLKMSHWQRRESLQTRGTLSSHPHPRHPEKEADTKHRRARTEDVSSGARNHRSSPTPPENRQLSFSPSSQVRILIKTFSQAGPLTDWRCFPFGSWQLQQPRTRTVTELPAPRSSLPKGEKNSRGRKPRQRQASHAACRPRPKWGHLDIQREQSTTQAPGAQVRTAKGTGDTGGGRGTRGRPGDAPLSGRGGQRGRAQLFSGYCREAAWQPARPAYPNFALQQEGAPLTRTCLKTQAHPTGLHRRRKTQSCRHSP